MSATQFTDDAFNKHVEKGSGHGTLIGNWFEERSIRECTGEGRTVPQRHVPRSGLLTDWTKVPATGPRKQDNTFERCYGSRTFEVDVPVSKAIGAGDSEHVVRKPIAETLQAAGRIEKVGVRAKEREQQILHAAEAQVAQEDEIEAEKLNARYFDTTTGTFFEKPDETLIERPTHVRQGCREELMHGHPADRTKGLQNDGMDLQTNDHYANDEALTLWRVSLGDPDMRGDIKASACGGITTFGRHTEFSKPMQEFTKGIAKDQEMEAMYAELQKSNPLRKLGGNKPCSKAFSQVPSLASLKEVVKQRLAARWGSNGYVMLRQHLHDASDHEGFVHKDVVLSVFQAQLQLPDEAVSPMELSVYLNQLTTMKKAEMKVSALLMSLRPSLAQAAKLKVLGAFAALGPKDGCVQLGDWLATVKDDALRGLLVKAFGGSDEASVADLPVPEPMFLEVFADLTALTDLDSVL